MAVPLKELLAALEVERHKKVVEPFKVVHTPAVSPTFFTTTNPVPSSFSSLLLSLKILDTMHLTVLFSVVLVASGALAAPYNVTMHSYGKRDNVCSVDFRSAVDKSSCVPKGEVFNLQGQSTINRQTFNAQTQAQLTANAQCDHTIELQLLDSVALNSGFCAVLAAMVKADTTLSKATLLQNAADHISSLQNLNFLDSSVNNRKKTFIARSLKGSTQESTPLDLAVKSYLTTVGPGVDSVATAIDDELAIVIAQANTINKGLVAGTSRTDPIKKIKDPLVTALGNYNSAITVKAAWDKVLEDAA